MTARRHLAYVCADRGVPIGGRKGASIHVGELTRALAQHGVDVRIIATRTDESVNGNGVGLPITDVSADRPTRVMRQLLFANLEREQDRTRAGEAYGLLLNQAVARELDRLHRTWRIDAVYERYGLWGYAGAAFARAARVPYLLEVNAPLRAEQRRYRDLQNDAMAASLESLLFRSADHVLVPSAALRPYVIARGARAGGVRVMPNAADPERFTSERRARADGEFVIGFLGTLKPWHGVDLLVRAFRRLYRRDASYRLLIAGDGPLRADLERMVRELGLQRAVRFAGEVDHAAVPALLAQMDVAAAPYPRLGGFYFSPLKVFEYLAAGVPVVASDIGQLGEVLVHGRTALLHRPGSVTEMVRHIERLRSDTVLAARMARAGRQLVARRFTWQRNAARLVKLIGGGGDRKRSAHGSH